MGEAHKTYRYKKRREILRRQQNPCALCGDPIDYQARYPDRRSFSADHIVPARAGGTDDLDNLQAAHLGCNWDRGEGDAGVSSRKWW